MTDYIKREDAIQAFDPLQRRDWYTPWIVETLEDLPSADVVQVVRCKDCIWIRYMENEEMEEFLDCDCPEGGGVPNDENFFCADGERKDDE